MKSYTDLEQSKKLAEFLPLESADMYWWSTSKRSYIEAMDDGDFNEAEGHIRAWSLAALLDIIRKAIGYTLQTTYNKNPKVFMVCELGDKPYSIESSEYDNEVDACYEMILKLHEQKIL